MLHRFHNMKASSFEKRERNFWERCLKCKAHLHPVVIAAAAVAAEVGAGNANVVGDGRLHQSPAALCAGRRVFRGRPRRRLPSKGELRRRQGLHQLRIPLVCGQPAMARSR